MGEKGTIAIRGGGVGRAFAIIKATYPAGAACTCSNGTKTLTAKGTSGVYLFPIPASGEWTVASESKSVTVSITTKGQTAIVNLVALELLKDGVFNPLVGDFKRVESDVRFTDGKIVGTAANSAGNGFYLTIPIELNTTKDNTYNTLAVHINLPSFRSGYPLILGFHTTKMVSGDYSVQKGRFTAKATVSKKSEYQTVLIDISKLSGTYYFNGCGIADFTIDEIWLE